MPEVTAWTPETPFLDHFIANEATGSSATPTRPAASESPFHSAFREAAESDEVDSSASAIAELIDELHDDEFDDALFELVDEAWELGGPRIVHESQAAVWNARTERMLAEHFQPLARRAEDMADALSERFSASSDTLSEADLEQSLDLFEFDPYDHESLSPAFENFLKSWGKKLKSVAKGALRAAKTVVKKGVQLAGGPLIRLALGKLRRAVQPMLRKLVSLALDKLPPTLRPLAAKLAGLLGGGPGIKAAKTLLRKPARPAPVPSMAPPGATATPSADSTGGGGADPSFGGAVPDDGPIGAAPADGAATDDTDDAPESGDDPAAPDVATVQSELDLEIVETLLGDDEMLDPYVQLEAIDTWGELDHARSAFVREISDLAPGRSPAVAVENFIPAVLMAVRPVIKLIGRQHVVQVIAQMITPLIQPVVGKSIAPQLGKAIADIGLRTLIQAELDADEMHELGARAVATVVEETVRDISSLPDAVIGNEALLESHVRTAYEAAVARTFPPAMIKPALRESTGVNGTWVAMPGTGTKYYKKFTRVFDVNITPQLAAAVRSFGGRTLASFMRDTLRLDGPRRARVHLYEAIPRTRLSRISKLEKVRGLGSSSRSAWTQLHPLTTEAATALLQQPGLGWPAPSRVDPRRPRLGQRFYYLEIDGAPTRPHGVGATLGVTLDFVRNEIRLRMYLSEATAQDIAGSLRKNVSAGALAARVRAAFAEFAGAFRGDAGHELVRVVIDKSRGATLPRDLTRAVRQALERSVGVRVLEWGWARLVETLQRSATEFTEITAQPADGVTCMITFSNPAGFQSVRRAFQGTETQALSDWPPKQTPVARIRFVAGDSRG